MKLNTTMYSNKMIEADNYLLRSYILSVRHIEIFKTKL